MIIEKTYTVTVRIDTEKAKGWKKGEYDWNSYPNWDINYGDAPLDFIKGVFREFKNNFKYSGLKATVKEILK